MGPGKAYGSIGAAVASLSAPATGKICVYDNLATLCPGGSYDEAVVVPTGVVIELRSFTGDTCLVNQTNAGQPALHIQSGTSTAPNVVRDMQWIWADGVDADGILVDDGALDIEGVKTVAGTPSGSVPCNTSFNDRPANAPEAASMRLTGSSYVVSENTKYGETCHGVVAEDDSHFDSTHDSFDGCDGWPTLFRDTSTATSFAGSGRSTAPTSAVWSAPSPPPPRAW